MTAPSGVGIKAPPASKEAETAQGRGASPGQAFQIPRPECFPCDPVGCGGQYYRFEDINSVLGEKGKVILLNAIVAPPKKEYPWFMLYYTIEPEVAICILKNAKTVESYIGHEATAQVLSTLSGREIPANRAMYTPKYDDFAIVVRLKKRLEKPEDVKNVSLSDFEFAVLWYT